jgi:hypothetical protein
MRLRNTFGILIMLLLTQVAVVGQGTEPAAPWPPDPNEIFEDDVQWEKVIPTETPQPRVQIDDERQVIQLLDSTGTLIRKFDFPPDVHKIEEAIRIPGDLIQIKALTEASNPFSKKFFLLDTKTGKYSSAPTVCDGQRIHTNIGAPQWTLIENGDKYFLCDTETDTQRDVLPDHLESWNLFGSSEDHQWLFLWARDEEYCCNYHMFSYHISDNQFTRLGLIPPNWDDSFSVSNWISSTKGLICRYTFHQYIPRSCYAFDLNESDSLAYVFSGWPESMFHLDDPIRFGAFYSDIYFALITGGGFSQHTPCGLVLYDNNGRDQKGFGYECVPLMLDAYKLAPYLQRDDVLYFLTTNKRLLSEIREAKDSVLKSYNVRELKGNYFLYKGEIESVLSISPDHHYAVLLLDDNGVLDFPLQPYKISGDRGWKVGILDMKSRQLVYQSEPLGVYASSQVIWLDDHTVIIASTSYSETVPATHPEHPKTYPTASTLLRIQLDPFSPSPEIHTSTEFAYRPRGAIDINTSSNGCYLLLDDHRVVNLYTFEEGAVLQEDSQQSEYDFTFLWREDNQIYVSIRSKEDTGDYIGYEITLPDCAPQQP